jgi:hypothetical protein
MRALLRVLFPALGLLLAGCPGDPIEPATPAGSGGNSMSCVIGGGFWSANTPLYGGNSVSATAWLPDSNRPGRLRIRGYSVIPASYRQPARNSILEFTCDSVRAAGTYPLRSATLEDRLTGLTHSLSPAGGSVQITTLDAQRKVVAGLFSFRLAIEGSGDLEVSSGRFDITYR